MNIDTNPFNKSMKARYVVFLAFLISSLLVTACQYPNNRHDSYEHADTHVVSISKIIDGDSLIVQSGNKSIEVRLHGIDAPELWQTYGKTAKSALSKISLKQSFKMTIKAIDRYKRKVVILENSKINLNEELIKNGHAWVYTKYVDNQDWIELQNIAKTKKLGLWKNANAIAPWEWRKKKSY